MVTFGAARAAAVRRARLRSLDRFAVAGPVCDRWTGSLSPDPFAVRFTGSPPA